MEVVSVPEVTLLLVFSVLVARHLLSWDGLAVDMGVATSQSSNLLRRRSVAEWLKKLRLREYQKKNSPFLLRVLRISPKKNEYGYIHMILHATCRGDGVVNLF